MAATEELDLIQQLYKQDTRGVYEGQAILVGVNTTLQLADQLITKKCLYEVVISAAASRRARPHQAW